MNDETVKTPKSKGKYGTPESIRQHYIKINNQATYQAAVSKTESLKEKKKNSIAGIQKEKTCTDIAPFK